MTAKKVKMKKAAIKRGKAEEKTEEKSVDQAAQKADNMELKRERPKRRPVRGGDRLSIPKREGFVRRLVNDDPGRVERMKALGYEVVTTPTETGESRAGDATPESSTVVTRHVGGGTVGVLMEIPEEDYVQGKAEEQAEIDEKERAIVRDFKDETGKTSAGQDAAYTKGEVSIQNNVIKR